MAATNASVAAFGFANARVKCSNRGASAAISELHSTMPSSAPRATRAAEGAHTDSGVGSGMSEGSCGC